MRIALISDIHANAEALRATLDAIAAQGGGRIVCLGDIVGYNTDVAECIALLRAAGALCVAGNHDRAVTEQIPVEGFSNTAVRAIAWTRRRIEPESLAFLRALPLKAAVGSDLVAVHGALHVDEGCELLRLNTPERRRLSAEALAAHPSGARICAFGHTHRLGVYEIGADGAERELTGEADAIPLHDGCRYLVNPGTIGEPRNEETRATFLLLDTGRRVIEVGRAAYDAAAVAARTRDAGLGRRLDFLPGTVRTTLWRGIQGMRLEGLVRRLNGVGPGSW